MGDQRPVPLLAYLSEGPCHDPDARLGVTGVREAEVRAAVQRRAESRGGHAEARFISELNVCQSAARIDLAAVNSRLLGWEIKTAFDSLERLPGQQAIYSRVFDRVWLVADERHIDKAVQLIPDWWGVLQIRERGGVCGLVEIRRSRLNRQVDLFSLVKLLWRQETLDELHRLNLSRGLERAPRRELWEALAGAAPKHITTSALQGRVRARLKERRGWRSGEPRTSSGGL